MKRRVVTLSILSAAIITACEDSTGPVPRENRCETGGVQVTVTAGPSPELSWDPACSVAVLTVYRQDGPYVWSVGSEQHLWDDDNDDPNRANVITPPISYGITPPATEIRRAAEPLESGQTYVVRLSRFAPRPFAQPDPCPDRDYTLCRIGRYLFQR